MYDLLPQLHQHVVQIRLCDVVLPRSRPGGWLAQDLENI